MLPTEGRIRAEDLITDPTITDIGTGTTATAGNVDILAGTIAGPIDGGVQLRDGAGGGDPTILGWGVRGTTTITDLTATIIVSARKPRSGTSKI
jgi:hypothetical protein